MDHVPSFFILRPNSRETSGTFSAASTTAQSSVSPQIPIRDVEAAVNVQVVPCHPMLRATRILSQVAKMTVKPPRDPLIAIIGTTGTGKSQLAVDLALRFNGEIINGDAVQMYDGLPIITNKISMHERKGVPHHLLGCIGLEEPTWRVDKFVRGALDAIRDIHSRGRVPILVGGTHYYTQSLLFRGGLLDSEQADQEEQDEDTRSDAESAEKWPILRSATEEIYAMLQEVDPVMASRWHPNDRRHIIRSLEIWLKTGKRASEVYAEQQDRGSASDLTVDPNCHNDAGNTVSDQFLDTFSGLRYPILILWAHTPKEILNKRLEDRVEAMCRNGLLQEAQKLDSFAHREESEGRAVDRTRGVYIAIGYKQFAPLLEYDRETEGSGNMLAREKLEKECIAQTQAATRRYAKSQLRWLRIKFINAMQQINAHDAVYVLDTSDPGQWEDEVLGKASGYARAFLGGAPLPDTYAVSAAVHETLMPLRDYDLGQRRDLWEQRVCEHCGVTTVTNDEWLKHIQSSRHKKIVKRQKQRQDSLAGSQLLPPD